jgi:peptide deformylase
MDHLDGILFIDRISALKRNIILRKLVKARKEAAKDAEKEAQTA